MNAQDILDQNDPDDLRNIVLEQGRAIAYLQQKLIEIGGVGEVTPNLGEQTVTSLTVDAIHMQADVVDIDWWMPLGLSDDDVGRIIIVVYDASNNCYYVGGAFNRIGGVAALNIAKYNLATKSFSALGAGLNNEVYSIAVNSSGIVYAGGWFTNAGGVAEADGIAKWDGENWSALANKGLSGLSGMVMTLVIDGSGSILAGGNFGTAGTVKVNSLALYVKPLSDAIDLLVNQDDNYAKSHPQRTADAIYAAVTSTDPTDTARFPFWSSLTSALQQITWANIKATLKTYFDTLFLPADADGHTTIGSVNVIANNEAYSFTPPSTYGVIIVIGVANSAAGVYYFIGTYRTTTSVFLQSIANGANVNTTTGILTGTTGGVGKLTISTHTDGRLFVENRTGGGRAFRIKVM